MPPRDIWQYVETFVVVTTEGRGVLLTPSGRRLQMLLKMPGAAVHSTAIQSERPTLVLSLRNLALTLQPQDC